MDLKSILKKHSSKIRFLLVGVVNTAIDFGLLFLLVHFGVTDIIANFFSSTAAFIFSFFVNRSYTFHAKDGDISHQMISFLIVTLFGLWIIQPLIITSTNLLVTGEPQSSGITLLIGKLIATCVTLVWNYILYARVVFMDKKTKL